MTSPASNTVEFLSRLCVAAVVGVDAAFAFLSAGGDVAVLLVEAAVA